MTRSSGYFVQAVDRLLSKAPRRNTTILLLMVFCGAAVVGIFVIRDLQTANAEVNNMYTRSVHGLQRIGELQYDAQETRRATLYALTTSDSNLQVEYADQSRAADQRVKDSIAQYARSSEHPAEVALAVQLHGDWDTYLMVRDEVLASILEGSTKDAVDLDLSRGVPAFDRVRRDLNEVKRLYDEDASRSLATVVASSRRSSVRLVEILGFTFLLSSAAVWAIQRGRMLSAIQLAKLQMEFVASVSHELRTPLAVLRSASDNIVDGLIENKAELRRYGAVLQNQSRRMTQLVDEILLFASTEDRQNRYVLRPLQVSQIIDAAVSSTEALVQGAGFAIDREIDPGLPPVMGDVAGISQCLQNLIGNAVKYGSDHRRITLRASAAASNTEVQISVTDEGIGIEKAELAHIFDPFYRSPRVIAAQIHGTGLGLALARRIAEAMDGRLTVVSEPAVGSTFTLHLRVATGEDQ